MWDMMDSCMVKGLQGSPQPRASVQGKGASLDNGAFLHVEPHPVLALGPVTLPVRVRMAVGQARHIEVLLEEGSK